MSGSCFSTITGLNLVPFDIVPTFASAIPLPLRSIATYGVKLTSLKTTLLSAVIGCCILNALPTAADTIKIVFNAPLTGFAASVDKLVLNGAKLSVK
ncbi:MAG: hypothetical protein [Olavius algarvensis Gamma 3 endosymbiont]|nr:MAG: hypothetical protein [Olavius algarvensis Gamma 3 endosymbiont]